MNFEITYVFKRGDALKIYINNLYVAYMFAHKTYIESAFIKQIDRIEQEIKDEILVFLKNEKNNFLSGTYTILGEDVPDPELQKPTYTLKIPSIPNEDKKSRSEINGNYRDKMSEEEKRTYKEKQKEYRERYKQNMTEEQREKRKQYHRDYRKRQRASK